MLSAGPAVPRHELRARGAGLQKMRVCCFPVFTFYTEAGASQRKEDACTLTRLVLGHRTPLGGLLFQVGVHSLKRNPTLNPEPYTLNPTMKLNKGGGLKNLESGCGVYDTILVIRNPANPYSNY